jgi:hypothetical protein
MPHDDAGPEEGEDAFGVRFRLFPQAPVQPAFQEPETVLISRAPGSIGPGPSDERMYVVDALDKAEPYAYPYLPPFIGSANPPVMPGPDGHFDHLEVGTREFEAAHMYGAIRLVLDIWENYFGRRIEWHFADYLSRLELVPHLDWDNAQSGFGFIETGFGFAEDYGEHPLCLNFDILSHELGHSIVFATVGTAPADTVSSSYLGFQEAASDIITLLSTMHFSSVVDYVLAQTSGNIYAPNELNRFAELSPTAQIRSASNSLRMSDVPDPRMPSARLSYPEFHLISQPMTGAVFDILVEMYQTLLEERGLISDELNTLSRRAETGVSLQEEARVQQMFDDAFQARGEDFAQALIDARDIVGSLCAAALTQLGPDLTYPQFHSAFLRADREITGGEYGDSIRECFEWRGIYLPVAEKFRRGGRRFARGRIVTKRIKTEV